jgi:tetratricopeptide (TPR) repeat protein
MLDLSPVNELRQAGRHEEARQLLVHLAAEFPNDCAVNYAAASVHDLLGFEREAVSFYLAAIKGGIVGPDLRGAYVGLGSTYRALGQYEESKLTLLEGLEQFPEATELRVFLSMTLYNLGEYREAVASLLGVIAATTADPEVRGYEQAIRLYADDLDRRWE